MSTAIIVNDFQLNEKFSYEEQVELDEHNYMRNLRWFDFLELLWFLAKTESCKHFHISLAPTLLVLYPQ